MRKFSKEERAALIAASRGAGIGFLEDLTHMRDILADPTRRGDARYLSICLRRLLVNGEIQYIAAPRIERFHVDSYDHSEVYRFVRNNPIAFFMSGGTVRYQKENAISFFNICMFRGSLSAETARILGNPDERIRLSVDQFLKQRILALDNGWVSRGEAIKYVANKSGVAHTGSPSTPSDHLIDRIRRSMRLPLKSVKLNETVTLQFNLDAFNVEPIAFTPSMDHIDPLLLIVLATAELLCSSASTTQLETSLRAELAL